MNDRASDAHCNKSDRAKQTQQPRRVTGRIHGEPSRVSSRGPRHLSQRVAGALCGTEAPGG